MLISWERQTLQNKVIKVRKNKNIIYFGERGKSEIALVKGFGHICEHNLPEEALVKLFIETWGSLYDSESTAFTKCVYLYCNMASELLKSATNKYPPYYK